MNTINPAAYEGDVVSRLRNWRGLHLAHGGELFDEAATEIERLRIRRHELAARMTHVNEMLANGESVEAINRADVDRPQAVAAAYAVYLNGEYDSSYGPDSIDEAMEIAADCNGDVVPLYRTPQTHATPGEGRVHGGSTEPVAWAILHKDHQYVSLLREHAEAHNVYCDAEVTPLYRSPTLTAEEREAIELEIVECDRHHIVWLEGQGEDDATAIWFASRAKMWRSLLQRLGGTNG